VLPAFPALALVMGRYLARVPERRLAAWMAPSLVLALACGWLAGGTAERAREPWARVLYVNAEPWLVASALVLAAGLALAMFWAWRRQRWPALLMGALAVVASLAAALQGFEAFTPRQSGKLLAERLLSVAGPGTRIYSVDIYDQSATFYVGRTVRLAKIRDEFDLGLTAEPHQWIPTVEEFAVEWRQAADAVAIMQPGLFHVFRTQGLPMELVHEDPRRILVRKP
jgi:hypothetical protein